MSGICSHSTHQPRRRKFKRSVGPRTRTLRLYREEMTKFTSFLSSECRRKSLDKAWDCVGTARNYLNP